MTQEAKMGREHRSFREMTARSPQPCQAPVQLTEIVLPTVSKAKFSLNIQTFDSVSFDP